MPFKEGEGSFTLNNILMQKSFDFLSYTFGACKLHTHFVIDMTNNNGKKGSNIFDLHCNKITQNPYLSIMKTL